MGIKQAYSHFFYTFSTAKKGRQPIEWKNMAIFRTIRDGKLKQCVIGFYKYSIYKNFKSFLKWLISVWESRSVQWITGNFLWRIPVFCQPPSVYQAQLTPPIDFSIAEITSSHTKKIISQHGLRAWPDISVSIYGRVPGSRLRFRKTEKLSEGEEICVRPTRGSGFSRYRLMVNSQGVLSGKNASVLSQAGAT